MKKVEVIWNNDDLKVSGQDKIDLILKALKELNIEIVDKSPHAYVTKLLLIRKE